MKKFKNTKRIFALVLAFAVVAMSMFTGVVASASCDGTTDEWKYDATLQVTYDDKYLVSDRVVGSGTQADPYIISTAEQLASLCAARFKNAEGNYIDTAGKYFKVADGMKAFYMNGGEALASLTNADDVKAWFDANGSSCSEWWTGEKFKGNFDGNGVTVYGIYSSKQSHAGLFHKADGATIKNVTVANSFFNSSSSAGAIVAEVEWVSTDVYGPIVLENCAAVNNYINASSAAGIITGQLRAAELTATNIIAAGNKFDFTAKNYGVFGKPDRIHVQNIIAIGATPWSIDGGWNASHIDSGNYKNAYTDQPLQPLFDYAPAQNTQTYADNFSIKQLSVAEMTAQNVVFSNENDWWFNTTTYPQLRVFHDIDLADNGDGTHSEKCDCGITAAAAEHVYNGDNCACGAAAPVVDNSVSEFTSEVHEVGLLDPSQPNSESNPYIIESANQMYSLMINKTTNGGVAIDTAGKYFKVADGVKKFYMNGGATVAAMTSPEQVKTWFESNSYKKVWSGSSLAFKGNFDGNGVTIYGIGSDGANAGLFPYVDGDVTIKNVTVKNSYLVGGTGGGIVGTVNGSAAPNSITAENCQVINNYISGSRGDCGGGGLFGFLYSANATDGYPELHVDSCIVYGNEIVAANAGAPGGFALAGSIGGNRAHTFSNSIFIGGDHIVNTGSWWAKQPAFYTNVYTDADLSTTGQSYTENQLVQVTVTTGEGVKAAMPNLDWNTVFAATEGAPVLRLFHNIVDGVCADCGITVFEDPCAKGHTLENVVGVEATTKTEGILAHDKCSVCDRLFIDGVEVTEADVVIPKIANYDTWDGSRDEANIALLDPSKPNSESNPYVIDTAEKLVAIASGNVDTVGKFYKVPDNIDAFYMNGGAAIAELADANAVKAYFETNGGFAYWTGNNFAGTFDGNGVTVYGLYSAKESAGLFPYIGSSAVIKNVAVKNSYFSASTANAGAIVGEVRWRADIGNGTLAIESCVSANNYFASAAGNMGAIAGHSREDKIAINNCLVKGNVFAEGYQPYLVGNSWNETNVISNTVVYDGWVFGSGWHLIKAEIFSNVYTNVEQVGETVPAYDAAQVAVLSNDALTVENMSGLDWANNWVYVDGPDLRAFHNFKVTNNGNGTHTSTCDDCGAEVIEAHTAGEAVEENHVGGDCVTDGTYDSVTYCVLCGAETSRETISVTAPGHTPADPVEENRVDATCDANGSYDSVVYCSVCGEELSRVTNTIKATGHNYVKTEIGGGSSTSATITFDDPSKAEWSTTQQRWTENGITVTNNKAASTSDIDTSKKYSNPARFYKSSEVIIEFKGMTKIVIDHTGQSSKYVGWANSFSDSNATAVADANTTTITFATPVDVFTFNSMSVQSRAFSITVYAEGGATEEALVCENCGDTRELPSYGDATGDDAIDNKDFAIVMQYINGWDVEIDAEAADVNLDGVINNKDYVLIMQYINGWDVKIGW